MKILPASESESEIPPKKTEMEEEHVQFPNATLIHGEF